MRRLARPVLALVGVAAVVLASGAAAAPGGPATLAYKDPAGDNRSLSKASDITSVSFSTAGAGKGKKYTPKSLVLTLSLAAPPTSDGTTVYAIESTLAGCGDFSVSYTPGASLLDSFNFAGCGGAGGATGDGTSFDGVPEVKGSSIVWTFSLKSLPGPVKVGSTFTDINAYTDLVDPVTGFIGTSSLIGAALYDAAPTDAAYKVG